MENEKINDSKELDPEQLISLMAIYLDEWKHRDSLLWSQTFKLFYANLIVIILPYVTNFLGLSLPPINNKIFFIIGIVFAFVFLYIGLGYAKRLNASSATYKNMMKLLGKEQYCRVPLEKIKGGKLFKPSIATVLVYAMFFALEIIAITLLLI